ncbi:hypothetical protein [Embleya sp. NPDC020886]|uniref:hypothetical protein n=1 Tax=Embleya sp. NPDC020886 TaxID=3363980 RepID=UPI003794A47E
MFDIPEGDVMANSRIVRVAALTCTAGLSAAFLVLPSAKADVNQCGNLLICIDIRVPGSSGGTGTSGGTGSAGGSTGGGTTGFSTGGTAVTTSGATAGQGGGGNQPAPPPAPADVALRALATLGLENPEIAVNPAPGKLGLVGLPVWMWIAGNSKTTWSKEWLSQTLTVGTVSVTAFARSTKVEWNMGDGGKVTCDSPGRPYQPSDLNNMSECGYKYKNTSQGQPGDKFTVTATVFWETYYTDAAGSHPLPGLTGTDTAEVRIGELQLIN